MVEKAVMSLFKGRLPSVAMAVAALVSLYAALLFFSVDPRFYWDYFHGECVAVEEMDPGHCSVLGLENGVYCEKNVAFMGIVRGEGSCDVMETVPKYQVFHSPEADKTLCLEVRDHVRAGRGNSEKLCRRLFPDHPLALSWRCRGIIEQRPLMCYGATGIDERIKCLMYNRRIDCGRLAERKYIMKFIVGTTHFYN